MGAGSDLNPANGVHMPPTRPSLYKFETRGPSIIAGNAICLFIITLATVTRLCLRRFHPRLKWSWDDVLMIPALFVTVVYPILQICMVVYGGGGKHMCDVTYHEYYIYHWLAAIAQIDFFVGVGLVKMSIAVFNMR